MGRKLLKKWVLTVALYSVLQFNLHLYVNENSSLIVLLQWREIKLTYPPSSEYLCPKARMSEARPLPSHTTTGTGGVSLRYSSTIEITLGPPSNIRATTGTPCPIPAEKTETWARKCVCVRPRGCLLQGKPIKKIKGEVCAFFSSPSLMCRDN